MTAAATGSEVETTKEAVRLRCRHIPFGKYPSIPLQLARQLA